MLRGLAGYAFQKLGEFLIGDLGDLDLEDLGAEVADELQPTPDFETEILWVMTAEALKTVFAIAREEPDDDLCLLTIQANTSWTIREDDIEEWPPE